MASDAKKANKAKLTRADHEYIEWAREMRRQVSRKAVAKRLKVHPHTVKYIESSYNVLTVEDYLERQSCDD